jgi:hypothetical protein
LSSGQRVARSSRTGKRGIFGWHGDAAPQGREPHAPTRVATNPSINTGPIGGGTAPCEISVDELGIQLAMVGRFRPSKSVRHTSNTTTLEKSREIRRGGV